jgi:hypothetical protein
MAGGHGTLKLSEIIIRQTAFVDASAGNKEAAAAAATALATVSADHHRCFRTVDDVRRPTHGTAHAVVPGWASSEAPGYAFRSASWLGQSDASPHQRGRRPRGGAVHQ